MKLTEQMVLEVAHHEAIVTQAYKDSVGVLTWAMGITNKSGHKVERYIHNPQPLQYCVDVSIWVMQKYLDEVVAAFAPVKLTTAQATGALSFHINTGAISTATWVKDFKAGRTEAAFKNIMNWKTPSSIIKRREREQALFFKGKWSNNGKTTVIERVTSNLSPMFSTGKQVDITKEVRKALGASTAPTPTPVVPAPKPVTPTLPPKPAPAKTSLVDLFKGWFGL